MLNIFKKYFFILRPHQWLKNLLLLFPPFFGGKILDSDVVAVLAQSFLSFSFAASCGYIINDIKDREHDKHHASKKYRPIARGEISLLFASIIAAALYITAMIIGGAVSKRFEGYLVIYLFLSFLYTAFFRNIVIADIFIISFGFLIRILAGGEAFHVVISGWLFLTVFIVSVMLAAGKRAGEQISHGVVASAQRSTISQYPNGYLEGVLWFSSSAALVTYSLYTLERHDNLYYTVPLVAFGLLRYIYVVKQGRGDPTEILVNDSHITVIGILWLVMIYLIRY